MVRLEKNYCTLCKMHSMGVTTQNGQKSVNYVTVNYVTKIVIMAAIRLKMVRF